MVTSTSTPMVSLTSGIREICTDFECCLEAHILHLRLSNKAQGSSNAYSFGDCFFTLVTHKRSKAHKDVKDIVFYHDPEDTVPLFPAQPTTLIGSDAFSVLLKAGHKPVPVTAGSRRSVCTSNTTELQPAWKKVVSSTSSDEDDSLDDSDAGNDTDPLEPDTDHPDTKEEAELDDNTEPKGVAEKATLGKSEHTADIYTTFTCHETHWVCNPCNKKNHFQLYKACCQAAGITMHPHAIPAGKDQAL
ncbi:uncharacterized protein F5891DRAFT_975564 [Suillus fuscotomentosus]|uniref:Uncharacterized protein n=1 Tax=Suillus fuscotomentosus TaxID=1912939 RepID=A0AAD4EJG1_9AGAM|nr:uncharacterized protein F5891DRAFT_975564 [Suillus fuscotomentosus]KAG1906109.1 hypothetical protein F5891DRAFT_975564 [Suillus fuscotomentosus]